MKTFDAVQSGVHETGDDFVRAVQSGMRHDREAAGLMNQFDGFERGHLGLGHPRGPVFLQKPLEGLVEAAAQSGLHQRAGDVRPARGLAIGQRKDGVGLQRDVQFVQPRDHFADAVLPDGLELGDFGQQLAIVTCRGR